MPVTTGGSGTGDGGSGTGDSGAPRVGVRTGVGGVGARVDVRGGSVHIGVGGSVHIGVSVSVDVVVDVSTGQGRSLVSTDRLQRLMGHCTLLSAPPRTSRNLSAAPLTSDAHGWMMVAVATSSGQSHGLSTVLTVVQPARLHRWEHCRGSSSRITVGHPGSATAAAAAASSMRPEKRSRAMARSGSALIEREETLRAALLSLIYIYMLV